MAQTMNNGQKTPLPRRGRPGQRQQERLNRLARKRRRWTIIFSILGVIVLIGLAVLSYFGLQNYNNAQIASGYVHSTATAKALITPTPAFGAPTPPAATPAAVSGKIVKTSDGLQYIDLKTGVGPAAKAGSSVSVYYTGWIQSTGKKFDSTYDDGGKAFSVTPLGQAQVIPGWNEGLVGMKSGGTRRLIIPPSLAYGSQGQGPIPANATLVFDVTAVGIS